MSLGKKPIATVSETNYPQLKKLFEKNNYVITYKVLGYYQPSKVELCFNDFSKTRILDNPSTFFDRLDKREAMDIPIYKVKDGKDYQTLFGNSYAQKICQIGMIQEK